MRIKKKEIPKPSTTEEKDQNIEVAMVEEFAKVGDKLSENADRVANEAHLDTSRNRKKKRRLRKARRT